MPQGTWLISAKQLLQTFAPESYAYLPLLKGVPGGPTPPPPPTPGDFPIFTQPIVVEYEGKTKRYVAKPITEF